MQGYHFLLRTRRKVRSEVALLFLGYNLKKVCNLPGFKCLMARLDSLAIKISAFSKIMQKVFGFSHEIFCIAAVIQSAD